MLWRNLIQRLLEWRERLEELRTGLPSVSLLERWRRIAERKV